MTNQSRATLTSERAGIYLQQLCKHFAHKIEVTFTPESGHIQFDFGRCELAVAEGQLRMTAVAEDAEALGRVEQVIGSHLERFAFREEPSIAWTRLGEAA